MNMTMAFDREVEAHYRAQMGTKTWGGDILAIVMECVESRLR